MTIIITPEIRTYAMNIAGIGNKMQQTGNRFGEISQSIAPNIDSIQKAKSDYSILLQEFKQQEQTLVGQKVPAALLEEHRSLIASFGKYVQATSLMIDALDDVNIQVDQSLFDKAASLQGEATKGIVQASNQMAKKLGI